MKLNNIDVERQVKRLTMNHVAIGQTYEALMICIEVMKEDPVSFASEIRQLRVLAALVLSGKMDDVLIQADEFLRQAEKEGRVIP